MFFHCKKQPNPPPPHTQKSEIKSSIFYIRYKKYLFITVPSHPALPLKNTSARPCNGLYTGKKLLIVIQIYEMKLIVISLICMLFSPYFVKLHLLFLKTNDLCISDFKNQTSPSHLFQCEWCSYVANRADNLQLHKRAMHLEGGGFSCKMCSFTADRARKLRIHRNTSHSRLLNLTHQNPRVHRKP